MAGFGGRVWQGGRVSGVVGLSLDGIANQQLSRRPNLQLDGEPAVECYGDLFTR